MRRQEVRVKERAFAANNWAALRSLTPAQRAPDYVSYLRGPDLDRRLAPDSAISNSDHPFALVIEDGLSALAVERHAVPLVRALIALAPQR